MRDLADGKIQDSVLQVLWLQRLPTSIQQILSISVDNLTGMALTADKISEISNFTSEIHSVQNFGRLDSTSDRISQLEKKVADLTDMVKQLLQKSSDRSRSRSSKRKICWYHFKFKNAATKCISPCSFPGNGQASQ